jgi:hypothetical protein
LLVCSGDTFELHLPSQLGCLSILDQICQLSERIIAAAVSVRYLLRKCDITIQKLGAAAAATATATATATADQTVAIRFLATLFLARIPSSLQGPEQDT